MTDVSIVTPLYEDYQFLEKAKDSIESQTYDGDIEWVIVDSYGYNKAEEWADTYRYEEPSGPSRARNTGLDLAKGDYIAFLDADDWFDPKKLEKTLGYDFAYSDVIEHRNGKTRFRDEFEFRTDDPQTEFFRLDGLKGNIATSSVVVSKNLLGDRRFDESLKGGEDYHLWVRLLGDCNPVHIQDHLTHVRNRDDSLSSDPILMFEHRSKAIEDLDIDEYREERLKVERYSCGRRLIEKGEDTEGRSFLLPLATDGHLKSMILIGISVIPGSNKYMIETLGKMT